MDAAPDAGTSRRPTNKAAEQFLFEFIPVCLTTCRSAANAKVAFERITAARSRGRSPRRRGTSAPSSGRAWRSAAATACWAAPCSVKGKEPSACRAVHDAAHDVRRSPSYGIVLGASVSPLPLDTVTLNGGAGECSYLISYLRTGVAGIDDELANDARTVATICDPLSSRSERSVTKVKPQVVRNDIRSLCLDRPVAGITEGALPPTPRVHLPSPRWPPCCAGRDLELAGLREISRLAIAALEKRLSRYDRARIAEGAGPLWCNFGRFVLGPKTLMLYFENGIVGTLSDGPQEIALPLAVLAPYFRRDWRAPAPSFDCQQVMTPVERAICSDVELARSERLSEEKAFVSAISEQRLVPTAAVVSAAALRQASREQLRKVDTVTCGGQPANRIVACLRQLYERRELAGH